jgi:hypothetical protein
MRTAWPRTKHLVTAVCVIAAPVRTALTQEKLSAKPDCVTLVLAKQSGRRLYVYIQLLSLRDRFFIFRFHNYFMLHLAPHEFNVIYIKVISRVEAG